MRKVRLGFKTAIPQRLMGKVKGYGRRDGTSLGQK